MLILNSGGTFNKRYNPISGTLDVPYDNKAIEEIMGHVSGGYNLAGVVYKDSLEMEMEDRKMIANIIHHSEEKQFIIVHGTDTMHITAEFLSEIFDDRVIVLTGAMKPFEIERSEASFNLGMSLGFLSAKVHNGVYICMSGLVLPWDQIEKNREIGKFESV